MFNTPAKSANVFFFPDVTYSKRSFVCFQFVVDIIFLVFCGFLKQASVYFFEQPSVFIYFCLCLSLSSLYFFLPVSSSLIFFISFSLFISSLSLFHVLSCCHLFYLHHFFFSLSQSISKSIFLAEHTSQNLPLSHLEKRKYTGKKTQTARFSHLGPRRNLSGL